MVFFGPRAGLEGVTPDPLPEMDVGMLADLVGVRREDFAELLPTGKRNGDMKEAMCVLADPGQRPARIRRCVHEGVSIGRRRER